MQSDVDPSNDKPERGALKSTLNTPAESTQALNISAEKAASTKNHAGSMEELQDAPNTPNKAEVGNKLHKCSEVDQDSPSPTSTRAKKTAHMSESDYYLSLLNNFQTSGSLPQSPEKQDAANDRNSPRRSARGKARGSPRSGPDENSKGSLKNYAHRETLLLNPVPGGPLDSETASRDFSELCQVLSSRDDDVLSSVSSRLTGVLRGKNFRRDLNLDKFGDPPGTTVPEPQDTKLDQDEEGEEPAKASKSKGALRTSARLRRSTAAQEVDAESDSSSTILSTSSSSLPKDDLMRDQSLDGEEAGSPVPGRDMLLKRRKLEESLDFNISYANLTRFLSTVDPEGAKKTESVPKLAQGESEGPAKQPPKLKTPRDMLTQSTLSLEANILESLDHLGGIKYEQGSVDLRRRYKNFEQLCFGLGCVVAPTKQELEMCSQLSLWGDEASLSQYETSVYQSCLLRSRAFEGIWKKMCNRIIGIIRKYTLQGIYKLLRVIELQELVDPFLKVVLVDMGVDRQDQQLFVNIMQEEMGQIVKNKHILLRLNVTKNNTLDEIVNQMYIQLYQMVLISSTSGAKPRKTKDAEPDPDLAAKIALMMKETSLNHENMLDTLIRLYSENFKQYELILIVDKMNPRINDILYLLQLLKRRKLLPINSVIFVSSNSEYLEKYCNTRIYSNLGIFECNLITVSSIVDDIVQVLLFDTRVQEFVPNFHMIHEIYDIFYNQDFSLTLFIVRIYQLYEQYYTKYIFSYLSTVPAFVFEERELTGYETPLYPAGPALKGEPSSPHPERQRAAGHEDEVLLPPESLLKDRESVDLTKTSDISTTTSIRSYLNTRSARKRAAGASAAEREESQYFDPERDGDRDPDASDNESGGPEVPQDRESAAEAELRMERAKRLYSIFTLLCISNNMSDNYIAYLELKLGVELSLQKVILDFLPLNTLILFQRRVLFQLGLHLLYKLLVFIPDSYTTKKRLTHIMACLPMFNGATQGANSKDECERPMKDLIRRLTRYINNRCSFNANKYDHIDELKSIIVGFNHHYSSVIEPLIDIQFFTDPGRNSVRGQRHLHEMKRVIDENQEVGTLVLSIRDKLHMFFFPYINTCKLANILMLQPYTNVFKPNAAWPPATFLAGCEPGAHAEACPSLPTEVPFNKARDGDIIMYIFRYVKYRIINMWKLFIIYYYIYVTSARSHAPRPDPGLVEIYIKFNLNVELLEKIHKVILLNHTNTITVSNKDAAKSLLDKNGLHDDDVQLCYLIKNSLSTINVKFL